MSKTTHNIVGFRRHQSGIDYHRVTAPLDALSRVDGINVDFATDPRDLPEEVWRKCTHIVASRFIYVPIKHMRRFKEACARHGCKLIIDVDDWWFLPPHHPKTKHYLHYEIPHRIEKSLEIADVVWTTNKHLAKKVRKHNKNVHIIPNAVDTKAKQWQHPKKNRKPVRFGYIAGNNHQPDLEAYDIDLSEYESYTADIDQYPEMLRTKHVLAPRPAYEYGEMYSYIDVSIIPLVASEFNKCKSHLKLIEAAFTGTAVICSPVAPYYQYLKPGENCLAPTNKQEWADAIKTLDNDKAMVKRLADNLRRDMAEYEMENINKLRLATL